MTIRLDYSNKEFSSILSSLQQQLLSEDPDWNDFLQSNVGRMMAEFVAATGDMLSFYLDRQAAECYLGTAEIRDNVLGLLKLLGYRFRFSLPALVTARFTVAEPQPNDILIPQYFPLRSVEGFPFITKDQANLLANTLSIDVMAVQGTLSDYTFTSNGSSSIRYVITNANVAEGWVRVWVNNVEWFPATNNFFVGNNNTSQVFVVDQDLNGNLVVVFGDGIEGKIPPTGASVKITVLITFGRGGRISSNRLKSIAGNFGQNLNVTITVNNPSSSTGGTDPETVTSAKSNYPAIFRSLRRAVTRDDFAALIIYSTEALQVKILDLVDDASLPFFETNIYAIDSTGHPNDALNVEIESFLNHHAYATAVVVVNSPTTVTVNVSARITISHGYTVNQVLGAVNSAIQSFFTATADIKTSEIVIGKNVSFSRLVTKMQSVPGVASIIMLNPITDVIVASSAVAVLGTINLVSSGAV